MTREEVARAIRWHWIFRFIGVMNPLLMLPQIFKLIGTRETAGISLVTLFIIIFLQFGFALHGFFIRDRILLLSNALAGSMTVFVVILVFAFQK